MAHFSQHHPKQQAIEATSIKHVEPLPRHPRCKLPDRRHPRFTSAPTNYQTRTSCPLDAPSSCTQCNPRTRPNFERARKKRRKTCLFFFLSLYILPRSHCTRRPAAASEVQVVPPQVRRVFYPEQRCGICISFGKFSEVTAWHFKNHTSRCK